MFRPQTISEKKYKMANVKWVNGQEDVGVYNRIENKEVLPGINLVTSVNVHPSKVNLKFKEEYSAAGLGSSDLKCYSGGDFSEVERMMELEEYGLIKDKLLGSNLIDIGCGREISSELISFAESHGVEKYVGIDKILNDFQGPREKIKVLGLKGDFFDFLKNLKPDNYNIFAYFINAEILTTEKSRLGFAKLIHEVTEPGSIYFGSTSVASPLEREFGWKDRFNRRGNDYYNLFLLERP